MRGLSLIAASGDHSSSRCAGLSLSRPLLLRSTGSRHAGSVIVAHGPSCPAACGIFPDQGSNPCPPHWQADSQPLRHQGSPCLNFLKINLFIYLFLAALSLCCCARAFSSCRERGLPFLVAGAFSLRWLLLLQSTGSRRTGSVLVELGLSCSTACGIFPDQGSNPLSPALEGRFLTTAPPGKSLP